MLEKLKAFLDLKAILMVGSLFVAIITSYNTIGTHTEQISTIQSDVVRNFNHTIQQDKDLSRLDYRVGSIETRQSVTDQKFEELNKSIIKLNETLVRLSTILEGNRMNNSK